MNFQYAYLCISRYYEGKFAKRSKVPYMNHINEGLIILDQLGADEDTKSAYCLHPIFQEDNAIMNNFNIINERLTISPRVMLLVMEYRNVANRGLSCYQVDNPDKIYLSPIPEVNLMLVADKVQNRKDFLKYHLGTHEKSIELDIYFKNWLRALGVTEAMYNKLIEEIDRCAYGELEPVVIGIKWKNSQLMCSNFI